MCTNNIKVYILEWLFDEYHKELSIEEFNDLKQILKECDVENMMFHNEYIVFHGELKNIPEDLKNAIESHWTLETYLNCIYEMTEYELYTYNHNTILIDYCEIANDFMWEVDHGLLDYVKDEIKFNRFSLEKEINNRLIEKIKEILSNIQSKLIDDIVTLSKEAQ